MNSGIRVSVLLPCYNAEKYIAEALESILRQTYRNFRVIVIDDGSVDRSREIIEQYVQKDHRVCLLCNSENMGQVYTRNRGLAECDTEYCALMDADDVSPDYRFEKEVAFLDAHPEIGAVGGEYQLISEKGQILKKSKIRVYKKEKVKAHLFFHNVLANSSMMFRMEVVRINGLEYCEEDRFGLADYRFWSLFSNCSSIANLPCVLIQYRIVKNSISHESRNGRLMIRNQTFDDIHRGMFERNGIDLGSDCTVFLRMFRDEICCKSLEEWKVVYRGFKKIKQQVRAMNKVYKREMRKASCYFMLCFTKSLVRHYCFSQFFRAI